MSKTEGAASASASSGRPEADDPVKVRWPTRIRRDTWRYCLRRAVHEFGQDGCVDAAAGLTFFAVLSVFPGLLAFVSIIGLIADGPEVIERGLEMIEGAVPAAVLDIVREPLSSMAAGSSASLSLVIGVAAAIWSASLYVGAFGRAMNRIYEIDEGRPFWMRKPLDVLVTIVIVVFVVLVAALAFLSRPVVEALGSALAWREGAVIVWQIARWPLLAACVVVIIALLYYATPNIRQPKVRWLTLGAIVAVALLAASSFGFRTYVANFSQYERTFGSLAGIAVFLIWVFILNLALLLGAEFNSELERGRQLQAGVVAEESLQLPPRDERALDRMHATQRADEERGALLRLGEPLPSHPVSALDRIKEIVRSWRSRGD